jgi:hypothetical protein
LYPNSSIDKRELLLTRSLSHCTGTGGRQPKNHRQLNIPRGLEEPV